MSSDRLMYGSPSCAEVKSKWKWLFREGVWGRVTLQCYETWSQFEHHERTPRKFLQAHTCRMSQNPPARSWGLVLEADWHHVWWENVETQNSFMIHTTDNGCGGIQETGQIRGAKSYTASCATCALCAAGPVAIKKPSFFPHAVPNMPQQRQDQHPQSTMMHPASAAGPPIVATPPAYSPQYVAYSPQQFPNQPLVQHVPHYQSQHPHVYSPVIQGNARMMAPPTHAQPGLVSSSATQYGAHEQTHAMYGRRRFLSF